MSSVDFPDDEDGCWNCGGDGYLYDCVDGFCEDAEYGCDDCARRCEICRPRTPQQVADEIALKNILAEALAADKEEA